MTSGSAALKVLMVIPTFDPVVGGAERQLQGIAAELSRLGHDITVVTRQLQGTPGTQQHDTGYKVLRLPTWGLKFGFHFSLFRWLLVHAPAYDLIHCHTLSGPAQICSLAGFIVRKPTLLKITRTGAGSQIARLRASPWRAIVQRLWSMRHVAFVAITKDSLAELSSVGIDTERCVLIPNGVQLTGPRPPRASRPPTIIYTGRLIHRKRVDLLLSAFKEATAGTHCRLIIVGTGPLQQQLEAESANAGLSSRVRFAGEVDHTTLHAYLREADVFVLPSESEGMSNSLLEAMAGGLAVIATDIEANRELIKHGENGLLFREAEQLASMIRDVTHATDVGSMLGLAAQQTIRSGYSFPSVAARYVDFYRSILSRGERPTPASIPGSNPPL